MPESETVIDMKQEYRDHYIRVSVVATPPLPHDGDGDSTITACVKLYDGPPGDMGLLNLGSSFSGDVVDSWSETIALYDSEDAIEEPIKAAKERVDTRCGQHDGVRESAVIALERSFKEGEDEDAEE